MARAADFTVSADRVQMGSKVFFAIQRDDPSVLLRFRMTLVDRVIGEAEVSASSYVWTVPDCTEFCPGQATALCEILMETWYQGACLGGRRADLVLTLPDPVRLEPVQLVLGQTVTLQGSPAAKGYTMDYLLLVDDWVTSIAAGTRQVKLDWTPPYSVAKFMPTLQKRQAILRAITSSGSYQMEPVDTLVTVEVPENDMTRPKIQSIILQSLQEGIPEAFAGLYIKGKTGLQVSAEVSWEYSPQGTVTAALGSRQLPEGNRVMLDRSGTQTVTVTATDQRGFSAKASREITVLPYEKPRVLPYAGENQVICQRADEQGRLSPQGTFLAIRAGRQFSAIRRDGQELNRCTLRYRIREDREPAFGPWVTLLGQEDPNQQVSLLLPGLVEDRKATYQAELSAADTMGEEHRLAFSILTEAVSFALYDGVDGAAFGKYPEEPHVVDLAPHMTLRVRGLLQVQGEQWQSLGLSSQVQASAYPVGRQEDTGCFLRLSQGNRVAVSFNCGADFQNQTLTINRDPVPQALRPLRKVTAVCCREGGLFEVSLGPEGWIQGRNLSGSGFAGWTDGFLEYFL